MIGDLLLNREGHGIRRVFPGHFDGPTATGRLGDGHGELVHRGVQRALGQVHPGQIIGFLSVDNGMMLAAAGAHGMPFLIDLSIAFSALVALIVFGIFLSHIFKHFDSVDVHTLDRFRGDQP